MRNIKVEFHEKLRIAEHEHKILESCMMELQKRAQQALLDTLQAIKKQFRSQLRCREEELKDLEESLRLMREESVCQSSVSCQKVSRESIKRKNKVFNMR